MHLILLLLTSSFTEHETILSSFEKRRLISPGSCRWRAIHLMQKNDFKEVYYGALHTLKLTRYLATQKSQSSY